MPQAHVEHCAERPAPSTSALQLIDGFLLVKDGQPVSVPVGGQRLLALLGLVGPCNRAVTAGTLWPEVTEERSHGSLRTALWRLHRLWPGLVTVRDQQIALDGGVQLDTRRLVERAHALIRPVHPAPIPDPRDHGGDDTGSSRDDLDALVSGELLPGWYDEWVVFERERLRQLRMHALEELALRLAARGHYALALEAALQAVRIEPLRESAHGVVIRVHLAEGNLVEARRHYTEVHRLLHDELDVEPTTRLRSLLDRCAADPALLDA